MAFQIKGAGRTVSDGVRLLKCGACGRCSDPLPVGGMGKRKILVLFEQPSQAQWSARSWFAGGDATVLQILSGLGLTLHGDIYVTAVLPCFGTREAVFRYESCLVKLEETLKQLAPRLIIAVGPGATGAVLRLYNSRHFGAECMSAQYYGHCIPLTIAAGWNCWLAPIQSDREIHANQNVQMQKVAKDWVQRALGWAIEMAREVPPKEELPHVTILYETAEIVRVLKEAALSKCVGFDYETNALQPETPGAKILTSAISYSLGGDKLFTYAFPMASEVVRAQWREFLQSDVPKVGANIKFEHRWSLVNLGVSVVNWIWDVCVGGRILDCVPGNSGLKFLTFVNFGVIGYDDDVSPFMKDDENKHNSLDKANVRDLLTYNGYDAYFTMECYRRQSEVLQIKDEM